MRLRVVFKIHQNKNDSSLIYPTVYGLVGFFNLFIFNNKHCNYSCDFLSYIQLKRFKT